MSSMLPTPPSSPPTPTGRALATFGELWRHPATTQKLMALGLLVASLAVGGYGVLMMSKGSERALFRNLSEQEAANSVERLSVAGIDASLGDDGQSVWVSASSVKESRMVLALNEGLPTSGNAGFEIFDDIGFGMTDFLEGVTYRRALEGELARTILTLDEVTSARVHLVLPRESVYSEDAEPAKASVALRLARTPGAASIKAIVHLMAFAVEGLVPENVVVVDSQGRALHSGTEEAKGDSLTDEQFSTKAKLEYALASKAVDILVPLMGEGGVRAKATVEMDFNASEETVESYDPASNVIVSHRREERRRSGVDGIARGIPGTRSNVPAAADAAVDSGDAADPAAAPTAADATDPALDGSEEAPPARRLADDPSLTELNETINYQNTRSVRHITTPQGRVVRRSVAVVVDDLPAPDDAEEGAGKVPLSEERVAKFRELVVDAVGLDLAAGDTVTVHNISFDGNLMSPELAEPSFVEQILPYAAPLWRNVSWVLLLAAFYWFLFKPVAGKLAEPLPKQVAVLPEVPLPPIEVSEPAALEEPTAKPADLLQQAQQVSQESPQVASDLVRGWLTEES